jgi:hypothetical protein
MEEKKNSGYKKRLRTRQSIAHRIGVSAYYQGKNGRLPRPLFTLLKMLHSGYRPADAIKE